MLGQSVSTYCVGPIGVVFDFTQPLSIDVVSDLLDAACHVTCCQVPSSVLDVLRYKHLALSWDASL